MKKTIKIALLTMIVVALGCITSISAFAAQPTDEVLPDGEYGYVEGYNVTNLPSAKALDNEKQSQIKNDYLTSKNLDAPETDVDLSYYGTLNDGSYLTAVNYKYSSSTSGIIYYIMDKYIYVIPGGNLDVKIYKNNNFYSIFEMYMDNALSNEMLDEIAVALNFETYPQKSVVTTTTPSSSELTTAETVVTTAKNTTVSETSTAMTQTTDASTYATDAQSSTGEQKATKNVATSDVANNTTNQNNPINTGSNSILLVTLLIVSIAFFGIFMRATNKGQNK